MYSVRYLRTQMSEQVHIGAPARDRRSCSGGTCKDRMCFLRGMFGALMIKYRYIKMQKPSENKTSLPVFGVKRNIFVLMAALLCFLSVGCIKNPEKTSSTRFMMDTLIQVDIWGADKEKNQESLANCLNIMQEVSEKADRYSKTSECALVNENAGIKPVKVSDDIFDMVDFVVGKEYRQVDITLGPVIDLWQSAHETKKLPDGDAVKDALFLTGKDKIVIDSQSRTVYLKEKGMSLDLGAVAKGWAVEKGAKYLAERKDIICAIINGGGNIKVIGTKPDKKPWRIAVQDPKNAERAVGVLNLKGGEAVATSGDYQRYVEIDGKKYHHLLSPDTGYPVNENISVTVVCEDAFLADYYSTLLFLLPAKDAIMISEKAPLSGAVIIDAEGYVYVSGNLKDRFEKNEKSGWIYK